MARLRRLPRPLLFWVTAGLALLVSHDLVYVVQVGPGEQVARLLREAGHGYWGAASLALAAIGAFAAAGTALRLAWLHRRAATLDARPTVTARPLGRRWTASWWRLLAAVLLGFLVQENVEHWLAHGHLIGPGALLGPEYPLAIPLFAALTAVAAAVVVVVARAEDELLLAIANASARLFPRRPSPPPRPTLDVATPALAPLATLSAGRAPPSVLRVSS